MIIESKKFIGCCGTYCKTCKPFKEGYCKGCKIGYKSKERDINRTKCKIKLCCIKEKNFISCADCDKYLICKKISKKFGKEKYNFKKCMQSLEFIKNNGYDNFIKIAENWKGPFGKI